MNFTVSHLLSPRVSTRTIHRGAVGALFFLQGLSFASWASRIPSIQQTLGLSDAELGGVLLALPAGLMLSLPIAGWLTTKIGSRKVATLAVGLYALTLLSLGFAQTTLQLMACLFVFGLVGNMANIAINTQAVGVEALYKRPIMASFHGLWSLAGFAGAMLGAVMIGAGIVPYQHFAAVLFFALAALAVASRYILPEDANTNSDQPIFAKPDKALLILGIIAFCAMICEGAMFDWSGIYFKKVILAEKAMVGAGYTAFMSTMALGRFIADWFATRYGLKRTLQLSGVLIASGLLTAVSFPYLGTAIVGFFLVGFGVSSVVPLVYSAAGKSTVLSPGVALAAVSTIGFLGFLIGPPLIGFVAGATSLRISFVIIAGMGLCVALMAGKVKTAE
ncbi:MFS transporter [Larkinella humicola]|uniref:MFS transporter n=1 Tax=Larkinella humicola TaxID=2607654 RepID=A0A5N1JDJ8_9BACT|nr:MFS transporter [Larkinella humicola]KAA9353030.1 MFS transporter [Larkinella humicola]